MRKYISEKFTKYWPILLLLFGSSWLWAPLLNNSLSPKTTLISQYEATGQPFAWLFRVGDVLAGLVLLGIIWIARRRNILAKTEFWLLFAVGTGMILDATFVISCISNSGRLCIEKSSPLFVAHAAETVLSSLAIFIITGWSAIKDKLLPSIIFLLFQIGYVVLVLSNLSTHFEFNTLSQYVYQLLVLVWLAWYLNYKFRSINKSKNSIANGKRIRVFFAFWAGLNGVLAIMLSLRHLRLGGFISSVYFANDTAWLAQHGVIVGVALLYISRHLYRGENRARQIFLVLAGIETIKYSALTPHPLLLAIYFVSFVSIFWAADIFRVGIVRPSWRDRVDDALILILGVASSVAITAIILSRSASRSKIILQSIDNYSDYVFGPARTLHGTALQSALLAHTLTVLIGASIWFVIWSLFRPIRTHPNSSIGNEEIVVRRLLDRYSDSSEDYFKLWPSDKQYFWSKNHDGFIAYKVTGPVAFALANPIAASERTRQELLLEFVDYCQSKRLRSCFLAIDEKHRDLYQKSGLKVIKIGASAVINIQEFGEVVRKSKWGRWQYNRGVRLGYSYHQSHPPHNHKLLDSVDSVSKNWLQFGGHREQSFALGHFDIDYLNECVIHYLNDENGEIIAFANQLPVFSKNKQTTIDLMRYKNGADGALPFLLLNLLSSLQSEGRYKNFDLGFVPLAKVDSQIARLARSLGSNRFSAEGLEQFKGKFMPTWQDNYAAYDGDIADLALIAINLERALEP